MPPIPRHLLIVRTLAVLAAALLQGLAGAGGDPAGDEIPRHLRDQPSHLYMRVGGDIVEAPPTLLLLARSYPVFGDKGRFRGGRRITLIAEKTRCRIGEPVRVLHVLEAVDDGLRVYVMGPKTVHDEYVDGENRCPRRNQSYRGVTVPSPAVDFHYDITSYAFATPGRHTIWWKGGGHPIEGDLGLASNVITLDVVP